MPRLNASKPRRFFSPATLLALVIVAGGAIYGGYRIFSGHAATTSFVTRSGSQLELDGKPFRFAGADIYWLGLDDNIRDSAGNPTYPTDYRIDNALSAAESMHETVVRAHSLGISVGCSVCLEPTLGTYNEAAFKSIDYAVESAGKHNIRLMIPLTDEWRYYHGGKSVFTTWAGYASLSDTSQNAGNNATEKAIEAHFYTDPAVIADYEAYISHVLNHVNQFTGVALKDDPNVMAWETGNELFDAPPAWTEQIASYIKNTVGAKQLVADGSAAAGNHVTNAALSAPDVDIVGGHFYAYPSGLDTSWLATDAATAAAAGKAYVVGEYAWSRSELPNFLSAIETNKNVSGDMFWSILPYEENGTPEPHGSTTMGGDDVPLYVPGTSSAMDSDITKLSNHALVMAGLAAPTAVPSATPTPVPTATPLPAPTGSTFINDTSAQFSYTGSSWQTSTGTAKYDGDDHWDSAAGNTATFSFTGTRAQLYGGEAPYYGYASFSVDGGATKLVDLDSANRLDQVLMFDTGTLTSGSHKIVITVEGTKDASASGDEISIDVAAVSSSSQAPTVTGDINGDGKVNVSDLSILLSNWGKSGTSADLNKDGSVNVQDLSILLSHWTR